jgi:receptor protein-tyrosine kinase
MNRPQHPGGGDSFTIPGDAADPPPGPAPGEIPDEAMGVDPPDEMPESTADRRESGILSLRRGARPGQEIPLEDLSFVEPTRGIPCPELAQTLDPRHPHYERIRLLRTELLLRTPPGSGSNAFAVLSASAGEGRTHLASELAMAFAQLDRPTLLLECDFRRPRLQRMFGLETRDGLGQALLRKSPAGFYRVEGFPSLAVVLAGDCPANPLDLLMDNHFGCLVRVWRRVFEYIVVDTPPVDEFPDASVVATLVGRMLLVSRAAHSDYRGTREMMRRLSTSGAQVVGGVINHF